MTPPHPTPRVAVLVRHISSLADLSRASELHGIDHGINGRFGFFECLICKAQGRIQQATAELIAGELHWHCNGCESAGTDLREALERDPEIGAWPSLVPLDAAPNLPAFPTHALPAWLRAYVVAVSEATQTPAELTGMLTLAIISGGLAGIAQVSPWRGYVESPQLYVLVVAKSGERKSPVFAAVTEPVRELEVELNASAKAVIEAAEERRELAERKVKHLVAAAAQSKKGDERWGSESDLDAARKDLKAITVPEPPRLLADDATPEAIIGLLEKHRRICIASAEGGGLFENLGGRYAKGVANLDGVLKAHTGEPIRIDRVNRPPVFVPRANMSFALAVQPGVVEGLADRPEFRDRGLLARILFALPRSGVGGRKFRTAPVPTAIARVYNDNLRALWSVEPNDAEGRPFLLTLEPDAVDAFEAFGERHEPRLGDVGGDLVGISAWANKLAGTVLRLAAVLHAAEHGDTYRAVRITLETLERAIEIAEFLIPHALAAHDLLGRDEGRHRARVLAGWIATELQASSFTQREAYEGKRAHFESIDQVRPALTLLEQHGYITQAPQPPRRGPGRPPSTRWIPHPSLRRQETDLTELPADPRNFSNKTNSFDTEIVEKVPGVSLAGETANGHPPPHDPSDRDA